MDCVIYSMYFLIYLYHYFLISSMKMSLWPHWISSESSIHLSISIRNVFVNVYVPYTLSVCQIHNTFLDTSCRTKDSDNICTGHNWTQYLHQIYPHVHFELSRAYIFQPNALQIWCIHVSCFIRIVYPNLYNIYNSFLCASYTITFFARNSNCIHVYSTSPPSIFGPFKLL